MREVVLDAIDAYVSAKEIELEKLLNPPPKAATKTTAKKKVTKRNTTKKKEVSVA